MDNEKTIWELNNGRSVLDLNPSLKIDEESQDALQWGQGDLDLWFEEKHRNIYGQRFKVVKSLFSKKSTFQQIDVVETEGFGKVLLNDGLVMVTERDEAVYHEMIAHVPLLTHPCPKNVLVIGGGDGGTVREVLKHKSVEKCTLVEIDPVVLEACIEHIPLTSSCLKPGVDSRVEVIVGDGLKHVEEAEEAEYDVILVDSTDPIGPAKPLFGVGFYNNVFRSLTDKGIVVSQGESPFFQGEAQVSLLKVLNKVFPCTDLYNFSNMSYPGGLWSFTFASKGLHPLSCKDVELKEFSSNHNFQYYTEDIHKSAFAKPNFMKNNLKDFVSNDFS